MSPLLTRVRQRIDDLRTDAHPLHAREVVLIASSSRGGSSVFTEYLRRSNSMVHLRGELNAHLALAGLTFPHTDTHSDVLGSPHARAVPQQLWTDLALDAGNTTAAMNSTADIQRFVSDLQWRLLLQWPLLDIDRAVIHDCTTTTLNHMWKHGESPPGSLTDPQRFHACFLHHLQKQYPIINPWYYDLDRALIRHWFPRLLPPDGPPSAVLEEPPFVTISPWRTHTDNARPLVIKTPSNAYRLPFFAALFPRLRILHLTRNAAAAINGLLDGWCYPSGFYAHHLPGQLRIKGYSDKAPWGRDWWQYDLPPGWREWTAAPLTDVCAFQWRSAHQAILEFLSNHPDIDRHTIHFEDLINENSRQTLDGLIDWLGVAADDHLRHNTLASLPPVMATDRPRQRRWFARAAQLEPVLASVPVRQMMEQIGYAPDPTTWI